MESGNSSTGARSKARKLDHAAYSKNSSSESLRVMGSAADERRDSFSLHPEPLLLSPEPLLMRFGCGPVVRISNRPTALRRRKPNSPKSWIPPSSLN
ncbi:MAG: hypothetical protein ACLSE8_15720 [Parasutterella sp.]